jgi:hypothetical protein
MPAIVRPKTGKKGGQYQVPDEKSGHYSIPTRKTDPILYQPSITSLQQRYLNDFKQARGFKPKLTLLNKALQVLSEFDDPQSFANEILPVLNQEIATHQEVKPSWHWRYLPADEQTKFKIVSEETITQDTVGKCPEVSKLSNSSPSPFRRGSPFFQENLSVSWSDSFQQASTLSAKFAMRSLKTGESADRKEPGPCGSSTTSIRPLASFLLWCRQKPEASKVCSISNNAGHAGSHRNAIILRRALPPPARLHPQ